VEVGPVEQPLQVGDLLAAQRSHAGLGRGQDDPSLPVAQEPGNVPGR
jgi:hypothetical protein